MSGGLSAIENGLWWLAEQQQGDGAWACSWGYGVSTGAIIQAFQHAGFNAGDNVILNGNVKCMDIDAFQTALDATYARLE